MNLSKKRKITAFVTVAIMVVAAVTTACVLAVPNGSDSGFGGYYYNNNTVAPTKTVGDAQYQISPAVAYNTSNASVAYIDVKGSNSSQGYVKVLYPNTIYVDKTESLNGLGYYIAYNSREYASKSSYTMKNFGVGIYDNIFGYYNGNSNSPSGNAITMQSVFGSYAPASYDSLGSLGGYITQTTLEKSGKKNHGIQLRNGDSSDNGGTSDIVCGAKVPLTSGSIADEYKNKAVVNSNYSSTNPTAKFECATDFIIAYSEWKGGFWNLNHSWNAEKDASGFTGGASGNFEGVDGFSSVTYAGSVTMNIVIYDKSELYAAIKKFDQQSFLSPLNANSDSAYDKGQTWINGDGKAAFDEAVRIFRLREVSQKEIDDATAALNAYVFELETVQDSEKSSSSKTYNAEPVDVSKLMNVSGWARFDTKYFNFKFLDVNNGNAESTEIKNAGTYTVQVSPKNDASNPIKNDDLTYWRFSWSDQTNDYLTIGTYTINKANLSVQNIIDVERIFKNSAYTITPESATESGVVDYEGKGTENLKPERNFYFPNLYEGNTATVKLSLDDTTDKSTWGTSVQYTNVTTDPHVKVYYQVSSDTNYNPVSGHFTLIINKAELKLAFATIEQTYGEAKMDSAGIIATNKVTCTADAPDDTTWASTLISQIFTLSVAATGTPYDGAQYLNKGEYNITATVNSDWQDRVSTTIKYENNTDVYVVNPKTVHLTFTNTDDSYYNNDIGHRSQVSVATAQLAAVDQALGVEIEPTLTVKKDGVAVDSAIDAGTYTVDVDLNNNNYVYPETELANGTFKILPRPITVTLANRNRVYAKNGNVMTTWKAYQDAFVGATDDVSGVFSATTSANDGSKALVDDAETVFSVSVSAAESDYTSGTGTAPIYDGAPTDRYFKANANGYALNVTGISDNYTVTSGAAAKLTVTPASIDYNAPTLTNKVYNGGEQTIKISDTVVKNELSGYEYDNFDTLFASKTIKVEYKVNAPAEYVTANYTDDLKLKNVANYTIAYKFTVPNHSEKTGTLTTRITPVDVYLDFTPVTKTYGDAILTSDELKTALDIKYYANESKSSELAYASELSFNILGGDGSDSSNVITTTRQATVIRTSTAGVYGGYDVEPVDNTVAGNYNIHYIQKGEDGSNVGVYIVEPKDLHLIWDQSGSGWTDGKTFAFNGRPLVVTPVADENDKVEGDVFATLTEPTFKKDGVAVESAINVGTYTADYGMLPTPAHRNNYKVVNPTETFTIVAREVIVKIMNMSATFGHAQSVPIGTSLPQALSINANSGALWDYDGDATHKFVDEDYRFFRLHSIARHPNTEAGENYVGVGVYPVVMEPINPDSQAAKNYTITLNVDGQKGEGNWNAEFTINQATINYTGRQFNIDFDEASEPNKITKEQISNYINYEAEKVDKSEFSIEMSNLLPSGGDTAYENKFFRDLTEEEVAALLSSDRTETDEITDQDDCGRYFVYIRITHSKTYEGIEEPISNYETFTGRIEVNIQSRWVSIILNGSVTGNYGDATDSGLDLYAKLRGEDSETATDKILKVIAKQDGSDSNMSDADALALLDGYARAGKISFFVGKGNTIEKMTNNDAFGKYSIFIEVNDASIPHQFFRFLDANGQSGPNKTPTNVGAYEVVKKCIEMDWDVTTEVYGEHDDTSAFHTYSISNAKEGDTVRAYVTYYFKNASNEWEEIPDGDHSKMHKVGTYLARVTGITDTENYRLPSLELDGYEWAQTELTVTPKIMTIKINDRIDLAYGDENATKANIYNFLNTKLPTQADRYTITSSDKNFGYTDSVSDVFKFKLVYTLDSNFDYLHAGKYVITYDETFENTNYQITFTDGEFTIDKAAASNVGYTQYTNNSTSYTGSDVSLIKANIENRVRLIGDGTTKLHAYQNIVVTAKIHGSSDEFASTLVKKNAQVYHFDIKIEAPDHYPRTIENLTYTITPADVTITMKANTKKKLYGDTLDDMLKGETGMTTMNDWLRKYCDIKLSYTGTIAGIDNDFEFIVVDKDADLTGETVPALVPGVNHNAGKYDVFLVVEKLGGNYNYTFDNDCNVDAYIISQRDAQVTWKDSTGATITSGSYTPQYDGNQIVIKAYVTDIKDGAEHELTPVNGRNTNAGKGTATVSVDKDDADNAWTNNYNFVGTSFNYEILKRDATVTIKDRAVVYGANAAKLSYWTNSNDETRFTITGANHLGEFITLNLDTKSTKEFLDATTYTIKGTCSSTNYNVTWVDGTLTVSNATVTNTEEKVETRPYNGSAYTADIEKLLKDGNYYTFAGGMTWADATVNYTDATISGIGSKDVNYTITLANHNPITGTYTITVTQAVIRLAVTGKATSVYGSAVKTSSELFNIVQVSETGTTLKDVSLDLIKTVISLKINTTASDFKSDRLKRNTYSLAIDWLNEADKELYDIRFNTTNSKGVYEVMPKEIDITWNYTANTNLVYSGSEQGITASFSGKFADDDVTVDHYDGASATFAGTYEATASGLGGADSDNYAFGASSKQTWVINPKEIDVEWTAVSLVYNGKSKLSAMQSMAKAKTSGLVGGDTTCDIEVKASAEDSVYAGKHVATAVSKNKNYKVSKATETFEYVIEQATVTVVWDEETILVYNGKEQAPEVGVSVGQLVVNDLTGETDTCTVNVSGKQINVNTDGEYTATATLSNPNYKVSTNSATFKYSITPAKITFTWGEDTQLTYNGSAQAPSANAVGAVEGETVEFEIDGAQVNATPQGQKYTATVTGVKANANYVIDWDSIAEADKSIEFTIAKAANGFVDETFTVSGTLSKLPTWNDQDLVKFGNDKLSIKYYSDEALTNEVTDIANAGEGKYWIRFYVEGNDNYSEFEQIFVVEVEGGLNMIIIIVGAVATVLLLAGAMIVVSTANKKKKQEGDAK